MPLPDSTTRISRRRALTLGGGVAAGGLLASTTPLTATALAAPRVLGQHGTLPAKAIQNIVQAEGTVSDGVLSIDIDRDDIGDVKGPLGVTFSGSFEIDGTLTFEPLSDTTAFFNGDLPLRPSETQAFIDALIANGLTFQAFHQHYIDLKPNVWFIHFRGAGNTLALARSVRSAMAATSIHLPQTMPKNPKSPLDAKRLGSILHGQAQVGADGVVTVSVSLRTKIQIGDVHASADSNISTDIEFKPVTKSGSTAWAAPDFSLTGSEVQPVVALMRSQGWFVSCLYNQETEEKPQLYFSHMLKRGDAYTLAAEIRAGLDRTGAA